MTAKEYADYVATVDAKLSPFKLVASGCAHDTCPDCNCEVDSDIGDDDEECHNLEGWFSWSRCDICDRPEGGTREPVHGMPTIGPESIGKNDVVHFNACTDCVYYVNYGRLDDLTMEQVEREESEL